MFKRKHADVSPEATVSPIPQIELNPVKAPGQTGPRGMAPRTNYSRVNAGTPPQPDAGAAAQKSAPPMGATMLPKLANEGSMGSGTKMNSLQDMVKAAMAGAMDRVSIAAEARRFEKNAAETCKECGKSGCGCSDSHKTAGVSTEYAEKFAAALEYAVPFMKSATVEPGSGPGALQVSETTRQDTPKDNHGQAHAQPPMHPGMQAGVSGPANQMANDVDRAPGGSEKMVQKNAAATLRALTKKAESEDKKEKKLEQEETDGLNKAMAAHKAEQKMEKKEAFDRLADGLLQTKKLAEDRINPAQISAGSAEQTRLQTSAAGEAGGAPVGGPPQGPTGLVGSNDSAINYNRAQARAGRKSEMGKYVDEPMMSGATDHTLKDVLTNSSAADGNKFAGAREVAVKTAAAKALLSKLAEESDKKEKNDKSKGKTPMGVGSDC